MQYIPCKSLLRHPACSGRVHRVTAASHQQPTNWAVCEQYDHHRHFLLCFPRGGAFQAPSIPDCRSSDSFIIRVTPNYSKGLPHRHRPSLTDGCALFLRAVIPWRGAVNSRQGSMHAQTLSPPTNHPALPNVLSPSCLLTFPVAVLRACPNNECSLPRLRIMADVHCHDWQIAPRVLSTPCLEHAGASA